MKSNMGHSFSTLPTQSIPRSMFNRSRNFKTTFDGGWLVPVFVDEVLPGDTMNVRMSTYARLATALAPFLDNMFLDSFFFAVPYRLLWSNWAKFNGAQRDPGDSTSFLIPTLPSTTGFDVGDMADYFGIPTDIPDIDVNALPFRAYNLIWNEWFRSEDLQDSITTNVLDGPDQKLWYPLQRRGKRHDYYTSALPFPQKGTAVTLPLGVSAPVIATGDAAPEFTVSGVGARNLLGSGVDNAVIWEGAANPAGQATWDDTKLIADLSAATAATINQIREAFQIQRLYERDARGGTRLTEIIRSHFGVVSPDARQNRPEFLGGGSQNISVTPVPQTSQTATTPQGTLAAYATSAGSGHSFVKSFTEHSVVLGLISVRADLNYQQGLDRMWSRQTRWDFYWPALAGLGEQEILNQEIYAQGSDAPGQDEDVWGYQERFAEYRYANSHITGEFRSTFAQSLDLWHLAQHFTSLPVLNAAFIEDTPPIDRVIADDTDPHFLFDAFFDVKHARPMPVHGVPGMIDHF